MTINTKTANSSNFKGASRKASDILYLVVHYTGNRGDSAKNNADYFARESGLEASAHYFVDESEVWQSVPDKDVAWHVGAKSYKHATCRNPNSIGIEICMLDSKGSVRQGSIDNATMLVRELMAKYGITAVNVLRHYDVTGKDCPAPMVSNTALWTAFKAALTSTTTTNKTAAATTAEEDDMVRYKKLADIPDDYGARTVIDTLMTAQIVNGDGSDKTGNGDVIDLSDDQVRILVMNYRGGAYDRKLIAMGMEPAVS